MKTKEKINLCHICYKAFRDYTSQYIKRTNKEFKETCDYCNYRMGWEYEITERRTSKCSK